MTTAKRPAVITLPLPVKKIGTLSDALSKAAEDGYTVLDSCFIPTTDGGMLLYILGDIRGEVTEADKAEAKAEVATAQAIAAESLAESAEVVHNAGNGVELPDPQIIEDRIS